MVDSAVVPTVEDLAAFCKYADQQCRDIGDLGANDPAKAEEMLAALEVRMAKFDALPENVKRQALEASAKFHNVTA